MCWAVPTPGPTDTVTGFRHAWAFLTRLPGGAHPADDEAFARSLRWFGPAGLVIGVIVALWWLAIEWLLGAGIAAVLTVGFGAAITGALHEDGLADTVDGLAGGRTAERRLEIMRDSRIGVFGVLALVVVVLMDVSVLWSLEVRATAVVLVSAAGLGRFAAARVVEAAPAARADGLGAAAGSRRVVFVDLVTPAVVLGLHGLAGLVLILSCLITTLLLVTWSRRRVDGVTGDVAGAVARVVSSTTLLSAVLLQRHSVRIVGDGDGMLGDLHLVAPWVPWIG